MDELRSGRRAGAANQLGGHEERQGGERELERPFGDVVGDGDADEDAGFSALERRDRLRTAWGSLELLSAHKVAAPIRGA